MVIKLDTVKRITGTEIYTSDMKLTFPIGYSAYSELINPLFIRSN
jgi:hypothetical protein